MFPWKLSIFIFVCGRISRAHTRLLEVDNQKPFESCSFGMSLEAGSGLFGLQSVGPQEAAMDVRVDKARSFRSSFFWANRDKRMTSRVSNQLHRHLHALWTKGQELAPSTLSLSLPLSMLRHLLFTLLSSTCLSLTWVVLPFLAWSPTVPFKTQLLIMFLYSARDSTFACFGIYMISCLISL